MELYINVHIDDLELVTDTLFVWTKDNISYQEDDYEVTVDDLDSYEWIDNNTSLLVNPTSIKYV